MLKPPSWNQPNFSPIHFVMIADTASATVLEVEAHSIQVEVILAIGLGNFTIGGLPNGTIEESRERIMAAISNGG